MGNRGQRMNAVTFLSSPTGNAGRAHFGDFGPSRERFVARSNSLHALSLREDSSSSQPSLWLWQLLPSRMPDCVRPDPIDATMSSGYLARLRLAHCPEQREYSSHWTAVAGAQCARSCRLKVFWARKLISKMEQLALRRRPTWRSQQLRCVHPAHGDTTSRHCTRPAGRPRRRSWCRMPALPSPP